MSGRSHEGHSCLLDQAFHGVIAFCHHKLLPGLVANSRYQIDRGGVGASHWLQDDDLRDVDGHRMVSIEVGEFDEHTGPLRCTRTVNMRALTQIGNEIVKGSTSVTSLSRSACSPSAAKALILCVAPLAKLSEHT